MNKVSVFSPERRFKKFEKEIKIIAGKILKIFKKNNVRLEIYLMAAQKMKFLNKKFRGKDKVANILSFEEPKNFISPPSRAKKIGEIYIKVPITSYPINQLLVHSLLHLSGYNHQKKNDRMKMEKIERYAMQKMRIHPNAAKK